MIEEDEEDRSRPLTLEEILAQPVKKKENLRSGPIATPKAVGTGIGREMQKFLGSTPQNHTGRTYQEDDPDE